MTIPRLPVLRWQNPVSPVYCADPFAYWADGWCYVVGTGGDTAGPQPHVAAAPAFPLLRSRDLGTWEVLGHALVAPPWAEGPEAWAPAVAWAEGRWYLYYSIGDARLPRHHLRVAVADGPAGPFHDVGPLATAHAFAIDPHPYQDEDGQWWLYYARDFLTNEGGHPGTGLVCDRLIAMTQLAGEERTVLRAQHAWTLFQAQRPLYGRRWDWHTLEGPCVLRHAGATYCLYSGSCFGTERYGVDVAVAPGPTGPWQDTGADAGPRVLRSQGEVRGPGHCSVLQIPGFGMDLLVYHSWDRTLSTRQVCIDVLRWTAAGPRCQPTRTPQVLAPPPPVSGA